MVRGFRYRFYRASTYLQGLMSGSPPASYDAWSREQLVARLVEYDVKAHAKAQRTPSTSIPSGSGSGTLPTPAATPAPTPAQPGALKGAKPFDFSTQLRRKIALRFCYAGAEYGGLAFQAGHTPLPTVEGVLFAALAHLRLVDPHPAAGPDAAGWEKCGRTDKGVSAAGQVVSFWVRSARGAGREGKEGEGEVVRAQAPAQEGVPTAADHEDAPPPPPPPPPRPRPELRYVSMLNRVLPPSIRALAWAPVAPTFSARFACRARHYKYFFDGAGLDVHAMQDAADRLVGEHDFRNLCKLDASKQMSSLRRRVLRADIGPVDADSPTPADMDGARVAGMYVLDLVGTAFLYNQVRHIMAVLFLVGAGREAPAIVSALLNVDAAHPYAPFEEGEAPPPVVETKPEYQMADPLPLVLWDCQYDTEEVRWRGGGARVVGEDGDDDDDGVAELDGADSLYQGLHAAHARSLVHTTLDAHFLHAAVLARGGVAPAAGAAVGGITGIPVGAGATMRAAKYVPLLERRRLDDVATINARWREGRGARAWAKRTAGWAKGAEGNRDETQETDATP